MTTVPARPSGDTAPFAFTGMWLRVVLLGATSALTLEVGTRPGLINDFVLLGMTLLAIGTAIAPGSVTPVTFLLAVVLVRVFGPAGLDRALFADVALIPLVHQLAGVAAAVPVLARVEWSAVRPGLLRYLAAVIPVEAVLLVVT